MEWSALQADEHPPVSALILELKVGRRIRLLLEHEQQLAQLLFLQVCADGSVICGPGDKSGRMTQTARRRKSDEPLPGKLAPFLPESPIPEGFHFTFHTSGVISTTGSARTYRRALPSKRPHQLCMIQFRIPKLLRRVEEERHDCVLPLMYDPARALEAQITLIDDHSPVVLADRGNQCALILRIRDATGERGYSVQLSFYHRDVPWSDATTFTWVSQDPKIHGFRG